jgi:hypothetical protein
VVHHPRLAPRATDPNRAEFILSGELQLLTTYGDNAGVRPTHYPFAPARPDIASTRNHLMTVTVHSIHSARRRARLSEPALLHRLRAAERIGRPLGDELFSRPHRAADPLLQASLKELSKRGAISASASVMAFGANTFNSTADAVNTRGDNAVARITHAAN